MSGPDFIETFDHALDAATCAALIARFEASPHVHAGRIGSGVDEAVKKSQDITITDLPDWAEVVQQFNQAMLRGLIAYLRKYPYTLLGPLRLKMKDEHTGEMALLTPESLAALPDHRLTALITRALRPGGINIQKYSADQGGYPRWHCELHPQPGDPSCEDLHRTLLWTIYLNDSFSEGETEFLHQQRKITPRTGTLLIAPTAFTHTHRGNMPRGGDKYIATSWVLFQRG